MNVFNSIPFFRILIPFVLGICFGIRFELGPVSWIYILVLCATILFLGYYSKKNKVNKISLLVLTDLFLLIYGLNLVQYQNTFKNSDFYGNQILTDSVSEFIAEIEDLPINGNKTIKCNLKLLEIKSANVFKKANGRIIAYLKRSKLSNTLIAGQMLLVKSKLMSVQAPLNPNEFDYKSYLYYRQIYHTTFIDSMSFLTLDQPSQLNPIWEFGLKCKSSILLRLKESNLSENAYGICAALLTGFDREIDKSVIDAFSHSGTLHVLSVSGLHTGLIYLVLNFLFDFFDKRKKYKVIKFTFITLVLWFFALITGFSAPVLRAVIMFNLLGLGKIYFRNDVRNQINILLVSAFILLNYNPFFIIDAGFQLSYGALFGILYFVPKFSRFYQPENKILVYVWQSITASFAATISTLPITLFYFKQFPIWFFICNILVVPSTFVILLLAVFVVLKLNFFSFLINQLVYVLLAFINLFNSTSYGFIDNIHFYMFDVFFLSLFTALLAFSIQQKSVKHLTASLMVLILWQIKSIYDSAVCKQKSVFTVYQNKRESFYSLKNKTTTTINTTDSSDFNFHVKPNIISYNYPTLKINEFNSINTSKESILILNKNNYWPVISLEKITVLVISNNFKLNEAELIKFTKLKKVVVDGSNNNFTIKKTEELSRKFGFEVYNTSIQGAYLLAIK